MGYKCTNKIDGDVFVRRWLFKGFWGRGAPKRAGPEGERASRALGPPFPFPLVLGPWLPPGPSLDPLAVHHTALMLESAD